VHFPLPLVDMGVKAAPRLHPDQVDTEGPPGVPAADQVLEKDPGNAGWGFQGASATATVRPPST
jgi:hypothetical protein